MVAPLSKFASTDKKSEKKNKDLGVLKRQQELNDIRAVLSTREGRRFFWRFIEDGGAFQGSFTGNSQTFYNLGRREYALKYFNDLMEIGLDTLAKMQKEHKEDEQLWEGIEDA